MSDASNSTNADASAPVGATSATGSSNLAHGTSNGFSSVPGNGSESVSSTSNGSSHVQTSSKPEKSAKEALSASANISSSATSPSTGSSVTPKANATATQSAANAPAVAASEVSAVHAARRQERMRNQAARAEEKRLLREEREAINSAKKQARSVAAKKAAATKKRAAELDSEGRVRKVIPVSSRNGKKIIKFKYVNCSPAPAGLLPVDMRGSSAEQIWLRLNLRDFFYRFDKLCRLPARFGTTLNDPTQPYAAEQLKTMVLALLRLIANDSSPIHPRIHGFISEIEILEAHNPAIWDWVLAFVEQLDAYAPHEVPTTEEEKLELLRRLMVLCTGTETIRITVTSDVDELKFVEKEAQEEIKQIQAKLKETEGKLGKLKSVDKEVWKDKLESARRTAQNKVVKANAQLFAKQHKYNMRTSPLVIDPMGNRYWSFQFKSPLHSEWGSWIVCELVRNPQAVRDWGIALAKDVSRVLNGRDELIADKNEKRKARRAKSKEEKTENGVVKEESPSQKGTFATVGTATQPGTMAAGDSAAVASTLPVVVPPALPSLIAPSSLPSVPPAPSVSPLPLQSPNKDLKVEIKEIDEPNKKRKYPKVKLRPIPAYPQPELYYVQGRDNILGLADWLAGFPRIDQHGISEMVNIAHYLAQE